MIVRETVPDRIIRTHHVKERGEERQDVSDRQRERTLIVASQPMRTNECIRGYLFSLEQKNETQGLSVCVSDGDWYISSEKHVNNSFNNSALRVRKRDHVEYLIHLKIKDAIH